jgi:hypothetical protein
MGAAHPVRSDQEDRVTAAAGNGIDLHALTSLGFSIGLVAWEAGRVG